MKKIINISVAVLIITVIYLLVNQMSFADKHRSYVLSPTPPPRAPIAQVWMQGNNINTPFRSDGIFNYDWITYSDKEAGMVWPVTAPQRHTCNYTSGIFVGAYAVTPQGRNLRVAASMYASHYTPGNIPVLGQVPDGSVCNDPRFKPYLVQLNDPSLVEGGIRTKIAGGRIYTFNYDAWSEWPVQFGAPYVEVNGTPGYQPAFDGDRPGIGRSDARPDDLLFMIFQDYTNCTDNVHHSEISLPGGSRPLGVEIHQLSFMFNSPGLTNMYFIKWQIINKSNYVWDSTYISVPDDIDIGFGVCGSRDDAVGCDTAKNVGFTYNADNNDCDYGSPPPACGIKYLQGPIIPSPGDTAKLPYDTLLNYRQLGLTGFNYFINSAPDPCLNDPDNYIAGYNFMKGLDGCGRIKKNPLTGDTTYFSYDGDACNRTGPNNWFDSLSRDVRFMQNSGPFTMNPNDTQIVTIGVFVNVGADNFKSVCVLLNDADKVQRIYNLNFRAIPLPPAPKVTAVADGNGKIVLYWTGISEFYNEFDKIDCTGYWKFQGYEVYQIKPGRSGEDPQDRTLLGVWDLNLLYNNDTIGTVWDTLEVLQPNGTVREEVLPVALGQNSGLTRHLTLTQNQYPTGVNNLFINGQNYFFSVLAYGVNLNAKKPNKVLKNPIASQTIKVTPYFPLMGSTFQFKQFDTLKTNRIDRGFMPVVLDQKKVISATYRMEVVTDTTLSPPESKTWRVLRKRNSQIDTIIRKCEDLMIGTENFVVDGIVFKAQRLQWYGVIRDPVPGYFPDLQTNAKGWTYTPMEHLNLRGVDTTAGTFDNYPEVFKQSVRPMQSVSMGLSWPGGRNFRAGFTGKIDSGIVENPPAPQFLETYSLKRVKIIFGQTQKAYRYVGNLGVTAQIHPFRDMSDVPFKVVVDDPLDTAGAPRQLNVGWLDADSNGAWNPNESPTGGTEIVYIFYSNYLDTPVVPYNRDIGVLSRFKQCDVMYVWWPRKINSGAAYQSGDVLTIYPYTIMRKFINPGMVLAYEVSTLAPDIGNVTVAKDRNELDLVRVVPNPYFGGHAQETSPFDRFVKFMRLPKTCNIYIYTLNGNLIRTLNKDDNSTTMNWDLLNMDQIPVASGIYIAYIDAPGIGTKIIKIAVFTPEERIDRF